VESDDLFALVLRAREATLRVVKVTDFTPHPFTLMGWDVDDVAADVRELGARGVTFERFAGMEQDELGIWAAPGGAKVAWFKNPEATCSQSRVTRLREEGSA
jgi:hypothetical protein